MYRCMAELERDPAKIDLFRRLVDAEMRHASRWAEKLGLDPADLETDGGLKLWLFRLAARVVGTDRVVP